MSYWSDGGASAVQSVSADGMVWTIKGNAGHIQDLIPGKIMLATGLGAGRILAVSTVGNNKQVVLGPVDITDVVRNGNFDSTAPVSLNSVMAYQTPTRPGLISSLDDDPAGSATPTSTGHPIQARQLRRHAVPRYREPCTPTPVPATAAPATSDTGPSTGCVGPHPAGR